MVNKTGAVHIKWQDPSNPNGLILTYDIEYMNQNIKNVSGTYNISLNILFFLRIQCVVFNHYSHLDYNCHDSVNIDLELYF